MGYGNPASPAGGGVAELDTQHVAGQRNARNRPRDNRP